MTLENKKYIQENRFSQSMVNMAKKLNLPYNRVRNYMITAGLALLQTEINKIKRITRKKEKTWDWDALP